MRLTDLPRPRPAVVLGLLSVVVGCASGLESVSSGGGAGAGGGGASGLGGGTSGSGAQTGSGGSGMVGGGTGGAVGAAGAVGSSGGRTGAGSGGAAPGSGGAIGTGGKAGGTPPVRFVLPWIDTFESNTPGGAATGWIKNPKDLTGMWTVAADGGTKVLQETVVVSDLSMIVGGDVAWTDQKVEARVKFNGTVSTDVLALLSARFVDFDNYYFLHLKGDGSMKIRKRINGSTTDLVTYKSGTPLTAGTWYTMGFGFQGSTVTAYLNGNAVGTMTEAAASHPAGGIALGVQDAAASFDDVKVTAP
ncbi:MAG: LamG-like jellyroll fold domain-containing protein [Bacteroidota bacterium]